MCSESDSFDSRSAGAHRLQRLAAHVAAVDELVAVEVLAPVNWVAGERRLVPGERVRLPRKSAGRLAGLGSVRVLGEIP